MALILISMTTTMAQFNIRGGLNFAKVSSNDESVQLSANPGVQLGFGYEMDLGNTLSLRSALVYSQKGSKSESSTTSSSSRTNYLEIPMDLQIRFGDSDDNRLGLYAGPYVAFLLSATTDEINVKDSYNNQEYGFNAGLTYDIYVFTLGLNYGAGLSNVVNDANLGDIDIKNQNISALAIFNF